MVMMMMMMIMMMVMMMMMMVTMMVMMMIMMMMVTMMVMIIRMKMMKIMICDDHDDSDSAMIEHPLIPPSLPHHTLFSCPAIYGSMSTVRHPHRASIS